MGFVVFADEILDIVACLRVDLDVVDEERLGLARADSPEECPKSNRVVLVDVGPVGQCGFSHVLHLLICADYTIAHKKIQAGTG